MLKMGSTIPMLGCFSFLVVMTVSPALCEHDLYNRSVPPTAIPLSNNTRGRRSAEDTGYLVGDTTPVWTCRIENTHYPSLYYIPQSSTLIEEAIDEWRELKPESRYSLIRQTGKDQWPGRNITDRPEDFDTFIPSEEADLHIIVALQYPRTWPSDGRYEDFVKERVVYAVTFWNAVHMRLKKTRHPRLRIRIDGIIVVRTDRDVGHQALVDFGIRYILDTVGIDPESDVPRAMMLMTGSQRPEGRARWNLEPRGHLPGGEPIHLIGTIYDDNIFGGLTGFSAKDHGLISLMRRWSKSTLEPNNFPQYGHPIINPPMPGQVIPLNELCHKLGWHKDNLALQLYDWCNRLECSNNDYWSVSELPANGEVALDGTYCYENKVCVDRECITKFPNTFAYEDEPLDHN